MLNGSRFKKKLLIRNDFTDNNADHDGVADRTTGRWRRTDRLTGAATSRACRSPTRTHGDPTARDVFEQPSSPSSRSSEQIRFSDVLDSFQIHFN
ncbi:unnamed protein product [Angiostrongylus costaricensis]|uniref:Uncharacterized protein n=1 Tax=Angiostrongylus costaricensis TaxID=334426 RepID=A0A0R3PKS2_ANGCS|nr:unnamed protein product [Angiostrongylus costaricensis]